MLDATPSAPAAAPRRAGRRAGRRGARHRTMPHGSALRGPGHPRGFAIARSRAGTDHGGRKGLRDPVTSHGSGRVTRLLGRVSKGDSAASEELILLLHGELLRMAERLMGGERSGHTLQPTALVNEAYLRLAASPDATWESRGHFFSMAATAMRNILVDHARRRKSVKRGEGAPAVPLDDVLVLYEQGGTDLVELDEALAELSLHDEQLARIVELRFFAGLSGEQIAENLGISRKTVQRCWALARAWLHKRLEGREGDAV